MARIRIIDEWLRSPVSAPTRRRAVVVVADSWSEQRVLMRAFAASSDQTRPTVSLRDTELPIGPAGVDPHGPWGIHVDSPEDGRAQELRAQLEEGARRLAGARRSPPRLEDEESAFERHPTNVWIPSTPVPPPPGAGAGEASRAAAGARDADGGAVLPAGTGRGGESAGDAPDGRRRRNRQTQDLFPSGRLRGESTGGGGERGEHPSGAAGRMPQRPAATAAADRRGAKTLPFIPSGRAAPAAPAAKPDPLAGLVSRTMPLGFQLSAAEREVLNALGRRGELAASEVAELAGAADGAVWMESFVAKLAEHGLDLVTPGDTREGGRVFALRH